VPALDLYTDGKTPRICATRKVGRKRTKRTGLFLPDDDHKTNAQKRSQACARLTLMCVAAEGSQCRTAGAYTCEDRHRRFLATLAQKKSQEKVAARRREQSRAGELALEAGFRICINGANRSMEARRQANPKPPLDNGRQCSRGGGGGHRVLRVPGARPMPTQGWTEVDPVPPSIEMGRNTRRQWVLGRPVLMRTATGSLLQMDPAPQRAMASIAI
jgi:hypothetical protein